MLRPSVQSAVDASISKADVLESHRAAAKWNKSDTAYSREGFKEYWELLEDVQRHQAAMMAKGRDIIEYLASFFSEREGIFKSEWIDNRVYVWRVDSGNCNSENWGFSEDYDC